MTEPLFDNRYRYDHIYPRGRSGETLRAVDTADHDRKVVIKRPAPQDAPPLRAAQAVSIQTEKKALERLSGHPCLAELRGIGQIRAGGTTYLYIVLDRAEGDILENLILDLAAQNQRVPELEFLTIMDHLLDLLMTAHTAHVIYNDVDAKHLFWNRDTYRLKVIDWGNAVMTDEVGHPAGITPANDIYQVGELLYFAYHGGRRLASETTSDGAYQVIFGEDVPLEMQDIITRATHPNIKQKRYGNLRQLREALTKYRAPLENTRQQSLVRVQTRLTEKASKPTLEDLAHELDQIALLDPSYPTLRQLRGEIQLQLQHLAVQADFDAARIYLETGNWARAIALIENLIPQADPQTARALQVLLASAEQFERGGKQSLPEDFGAVIDAVLDNRGQVAAKILMAIADYDSYFGGDALLIAERLAVFLPNVVLLRPHLARLIQELTPLEPALAHTFQTQLDDLHSSIQAGIAPLIDRYGDLAIQLADQTEQLEQLARQQGLADEHFSASAERAQHAAQQMVKTLKEVGYRAYSQPDQARQAIQNARVMDSANPNFDELERYLAGIEQVVANLANFQPQADGANILYWAQTSAESLQIYPDLTDPNFVGIGRALAELQTMWSQVMDMLVLGRKSAPVDLLSQTAQTLRPYNARVAGWLDNFARQIQDAREPERFAQHQALANLLLEGYQAWDGGQGGKAGEYARRALQIAQTDGEKSACERLQKLADFSARWLTEDGLHNPALTDETEKALFTLLLKDEANEYDRFSRQMKSEDTYLKAMKLGMVSFMVASSSVGWRVLFAHYILRGVIEIQEGHLDAADFWRQAALVTYAGGKTHPLFTAFDGEITRRHLIIRAEQALSQVRDFQDLPELKNALNAPLADKWLKDAQKAVTLTEDIRRLWADGEFRAVRDHLNQALDLLKSADEQGLNITPFRAWLTPYRDRALELVERRQIVEQAAMVGNPKPDPDVLRALEQIVDISEATFGADYSRQVRIWRDLYKQMLRTHINIRLEKQEKVAEFQGNFSALFVEKHPAYRLFQRWYETALALPEDVAEELQIQIETAETDTTTEAPIFEEDTPPVPSAEMGEAATFEEDEIQARRPQQAQSEGTGNPWNVVIIGAIVVLVVFGAFAVFQMLNQGEVAPVAGFEATPTLAVLNAQDATQTAQARAAIILPTNTPPTSTDTLKSTATKTSTPLPTTPVPSSTTTPLPITASPTPTVIIPTIAPTLTPTLAVTIVTNTPPPLPTHTPIPVLPTATSLDVAPDIGNRVSVLEVLSLIQPADYDWDANFFNQGAGGIWQLGASVESAGSAPIAVILSPAFMESFNLQTGLRLRRVDVEMELTLYDEARLADDQVFFGIGLQTAQRQRYSTQVQVRGSNVVSLGINENGTFRTISQLPLSPIKVTLSIEREDDGTLTFFVNGQQLGKSPALFPLDQAVSVVLYNAGGGMFVSVSDLTLQLAPYNQ